MPDELTKHEPVTVSLDVVWQGSSGKQDARMSEISMAGCFIDSSTTSYHEDVFKQRTK